MAGFTRTVSGNFDLLFGARDRLFKSQSQIVAKIFSASATSATIGATTKELAEDVTENVFETRGEVESAGKGTAIAEGRMTELVVLRAFLCFRQDLIGLRNFLELLFSACLSPGCGPDDIVAPVSGTLF